MMNLCRSVGKKSSHFCVWHQSHPLLGHFLCILRLDRMLSAPKLCMICSLRYLLEFYNLSTYFPVYRQIDNKTKCINPRIRDTNSFYSPPSVSACYACICILLWVCVFVSALTCQLTESFFTLVSFLVCSLFIFLRPVRLKETRKK